ncbi:MAG: hypothetical protein K9G62_07980 [Alphaproteobacteria bacterium]|nr:hypothetical protein [Alphaproteobacteria bacterium]
MTDIKTITYPGYDVGRHPTLRSCGILENTRNGKPYIQIFQTQGTDAHDLLIRAPMICAAVLKQVRPSENLDSVEWGYSAGSSHTDISFESRHGHVTGMTLNNHLITRIGHAQPLEKYQAALNDPRGFMHGLNEEDPLFQGSPVHRVVVPLPKHPAGYIALKPPERENREVVFADPEKLIEFWANQTLRENKAQNMDNLVHIYNENKKYMPGDDNPIAPFHSTIEESLSHLSPEIGYPDTPPMASFWPAPSPSKKSSILSGLFYKESSRPNEIAFTNGRHRTLNLYKAGAPFVPIDMYTHEYTEEFRRKFEWKGEKNLPSPSIDKEIRL